MNKKYFIYAASALAFTACSNDDFVGNNGGNEPGNGDVAIQFGGNAGKITRATSNTGSTAQEKLGYQFKIYGVKKAASTEDDENKYTDVFKNYMLWWDNDKISNSNSAGWEYVGNKDGQYGQSGSKVTLSSNQTIKYWDYSAEDYHFVAIAGDNDANFALEKGDITSATIKGLKGHINANKVGSEEWNAATAPAPIYVAEPVVAKKSKDDNKSDYQNVVKFNFIRQQSKVRVGIYGNIPGYTISSIQFYKQGESSLELDNTNKNNVILTSSTANYFVGTKSATNEEPTETEGVTGTITYTWSSADAPSYSLKYDDTEAFEQAKNWYGGEFKNGITATSSAESDISALYGVDKDMEANGYFTVMPTPSGTTVAAILIKCDYTLTSTDGSNETIKVTGATAAIPAAFCKWESNITYTYLFKISQNTNGTTGSGNDPAGLFPITFDAVVENSKDMTEQGTITTITTPSITTHQEGSVTEKGIKYVTGKDITATVTDNTTGTVETISKSNAGDAGDAVAKGTVRVYYYSTATTEADLQVNKPSDPEFTSTVTTNVLSFTPDKAGYYVIQYLQKAATGSEGSEDYTPAVYTYKVVNVVAASTSSGSND